MKHANELNTMYHNALAEALAQSRKKATDLLETTIAPKMEEMAAKGFYGYTCSVEADVSIETIITQLQENGYKVNRTGRKLAINWL